MKKDYILSNTEIKQIKSYGISEEKIYEQLKIFERGTSYSNIIKAATLNDGIISFNDFDKEEVLELKKQFFKAKEQGRLSKFVPASGAATRMFKNLLSFLNTECKKNSLSLKHLEQNIQNLSKDEKELYDTLVNLDKFAFYSDLSNSLAQDSLDIDKLIKENDYKTILLYLLTDKGLDYSNLPKAFLKFHKYNKDNSNEIRTSIEEQFLEGMQYTKDNNGNIRLHFTVSVDIEDKESNERKLIDSLVEKYEKNGNKFILTFSKQKLSTNTIAVDEENIPFKDNNGNLVLRAGGHGALIENLNDLDSADIVFVKNIDNVVVDRFKETTYEYKEIMGGVLLKLQDQIFYYLKKFSSVENESSNNNIEIDFKEIIEFMSNKLNISFSNNDKFDLKSDIEKKNILFEKLNRPIRICGMVMNQGEPGGGPYWVKGKNENLSLQIVEKDQIDLSISKAKDELEKATHFNPVDIVFSMRDFENDKFNLLNFVNKDAYFISDKSLNGKKLKALELPGLWNGAMSEWITVFIEVPLITFNPVKTVNDLLRKEHQV